MSDNRTNLTYFHKGEIGLVFGILTPEPDTFFTIVTPFPTCTLYDLNTNLAVSGISAVSASGYDVGSLPVVRAWYELDTTALPIGDYALTYVINVMGSDTIPRRLMPNCTVRVVSPSTVLAF